MWLGWGREQGQEQDWREERHKGRAKNKWGQKSKQDYNQMLLGCPASALSMQSNGWVPS